MLSAHKIFSVLDPLPPKSAICVEVSRNLPRFIATVSPIPPNSNESACPGYKYQVKLVDNFNQIVYNGTTNSQGKHFN